MYHKATVLIDNILKKCKARKVSLIFLMLACFYVQGQNLEVVGKLKVVDGTQGEGKVLTSDADGEASWVDPNDVLVNVIQHLPGGVQALLSGGLSPLNLYNLGVPLGSLYGKIYAGGYIFYLDIDDEHPFEGMVAAMSDLESLAHWGCPGTSIPTLYPLGEGRPNTALITSICADQNIGAKRCEDLVVMGYNDWFLPNPNEYGRMRANLYVKNIGNILDNSLYLTSFSSIPRPDLAEMFKFSENDTHERHKNSPYVVRPAREF